MKGDGEPVTDRMKRVKRGVGSSKRNKGLKRRVGMAGNCWKGDSRKHIADGNRDIGLLEGYA